MYIYLYIYICIRRRLSVVTEIELIWAFKPSYIELVEVRCIVFYRGKKTMNILKHFPSYVGPSKIRTLVIPVGHWKRNEFNDAVQSLSEFSEIHLSDVTPIDSPIFTPQGFPHGRLFFEFLTIDHDNALELFLYDFEPFRKTFVIIGLVNDSSDPSTNLNFMKEKYPTLISPNLIYTSASLTTEFIQGIDAIENAFTSTPDMKKFRDDYVRHSKKLSDRFEQLLLFIQACHFEITGCDRGELGTENNADKTE